MAVVGDRELASGEVAVRHRREGDLGRWSLEAFIQRLRREVEQRSV